MKDWSLTNSLAYFDVTLTWFLRMYALKEFEDEIRKSLYFKTSLHEVARNGIIECVRSLLDGGADLTAINVRWRVCESE